MKFVSTVFSTQIFSKFELH